MTDFVAIYTALVMSGKISIDKVPAKYRDAVNAEVETAADAE